MENTNTDNENKKEDWTKLDPQFAEKELWTKKTFQQLWEELGFTYQIAQEWITADFKPENYNSVKEWISYDFTLEQVKEWLAIGLLVNDYQLATHARAKGYLITNIDYQELKKEFEGEKDAQEYLDIFYPVEKRKTITRLWISKKNLKENLTINGEEWPNLKIIDCSGNQLTSLEIINCEKLIKIETEVNKLVSLKIINCNRLIKIIALNNKLTSLEIINCEKLFEINASSNQLSISTITNLTVSLTDLNLRRNQLTGDLTIFSQLTNLEDLNISENQFSGSLEPLKNLTKLKNLNIEFTKLDSGLEYLPDSLKQFKCQITKLSEQLATFDGNWKLWKKEQQIISLRENQILFTEKEKEITFLETRVQELSNLIQEQKSKIIQDFLTLFPSSVQELLKELITVHLAFTKAKKQRQPIIELKKQKEKLYQQLVEKLKDNLIEKIEYILDDCESLVDKEIELEIRLNSKTFLIEDQKQSPLFQLTNAHEIIEFSNLKKELTIKEKINQKQLQELKLAAKQSLDLQIELAKKDGQLMVYQKITSDQNWLDKLLANEELLQNNPNLLEQLNHLLAIKQMFLNARQTTINRMRTVCDLLEEANIGKYAKIEEASKALAASGKLIGNWLPLNIIEPIGDGSSALNLRNKRKFAIKNSSVFQNLLTLEETSLAEFKKTYLKLSSLISNLKKEEVSLFTTRYKIYEIATNLWVNKKHIEVADMKDAISALMNNLLDLKTELKTEETTLRSASEKLENSMQSLVLQNAP